MSNATTTKTTKLTPNQTHVLLWIADEVDGQVAGMKDRALLPLREKGLVARRPISGKGRHPKARWTITDAGREAIVGVTECKVSGCLGHTFEAAGQDNDQEETQTKGETMIKKTKKEDGRISRWAGQSEVVRDEGTRMVDFSVRDQKGRLVGTTIKLGRVRVNPVTGDPRFDSLSDEEKAEADARAGYYFSAKPQATRDSVRFGASKPKLLFTTFEAREAWIERYLDGARKRAEKKFAKTEEPTPEPVEVPNYATKALETAYALLSEEGARKCSAEEIDRLESLLNILACSLHPETREAGESMNFVDLFDRVHKNEDATPLDRAYYHIALAQSALISLKQERA